MVHVTQPVKVCGEPRAIHYIPIRTASAMARIKRLLKCTTALFGWIRWNFILEILS